MVEKERAEAAAKRLLQVFIEPRERPRNGLMPHEFAHAFRSGGWSHADFKVAEKYAYAAGWIVMKGQLYCLTDGGSRIIDPSPIAPA